MVKQWDPISDMPSLDGKKAVVTGGYGGIGLSAVKFLALRGATVYLAARTGPKAEAAIESLMASHPSIAKGQIIWLPLDLSDLGSVAAAAQELKRKESEIDILINNAAIVTASTETFGEGWEPHMAVNYVGHFVFTNSILSLLKNSAKTIGADVRIITLSSEASNIFFADGYPFNFKTTEFLTHPVPHYPRSWAIFKRIMFKVDMVRYAASKMANQMFAQELQRILDEQNIPILSIGTDPGGVASDGVRTIGTGFYDLIVNWTFSTTDQGAATPLFAATAKEVRVNSDKFKGKYLKPVGQVAKNNDVLEDQEQLRGMWKITTSAVNAHLKKRGLQDLVEW